MAVIDDDGRLFGTINVVDALVVLVALAIALAGIALIVDNTEAPETETRYLTLDLGTEPTFEAEQLSVGDTATGSPGSVTMTVTDTYFARVPTEPCRNRTCLDSGIRTVLRVAVTGQVSDGQFTVDGEPLRLGRQIEFATDTYAVNGTIQAVGDGETLEIRNETVTVRMQNVGPERADDVREGATETVAGQTVARVGEVRTTPATVVVANETGLYERTHPVNQDVTFTVALRVREQSSERWFKGQSLQEGRQLFFDFGTTAVRASVVDVGDS